MQDKTLKHTKSYQILCPATPGAPARAAIAPLLAWEACMYMQSINIYQPLHAGRKLLWDVLAPASLRFCAMCSSRTVSCATSRTDVVKSWKCGQGSCFETDCLHSALEESATLFLLRATDIY